MFFIRVKIKHLRENMALFNCHLFNIIWAMKFNRQYIFLKRWIIKQFLRWNAIKVALSMIYGSIVTKLSKGKRRVHNLSAITRSYKSNVSLRTWTISGIEEIEVHVGRSKIGVIWLQFIQLLVDNKICNKQNWIITL